MRVFILILVLSMTGCIHNPFIMDKPDLRSWTISADYSDYTGGHKIDFPPYYSIGLSYTFDSYK